MEIYNLLNQDNKVAYDTLLELEDSCKTSNELYRDFDVFLKFLDSDKTFVRIRGFRLICALAKRDVENKINKNIDKILKELEDSTSTSVRQCLGKIGLLIIEKPELNNFIVDKLNSLDLSNYNESMQSLIRKDIEDILHTLSK